MRSPWSYWGAGLSSEYHPLCYVWQFPTFTLSTEEPDLPDIGVWNTQLEFSQSHGVETNTDLLIAGVFHQWFQSASATPSVQAITLMRSIHRFQFGGMFRRLN